MDRSSGISLSAPRLRILIRHGLLLKRCCQHSRQLIGGQAREGFGDRFKPPCPCLCPWHFRIGLFSCVFWGCFESLSKHFQHSQRVARKRRTWKNTEFFRALCFWVRPGFASFARLWVHWWGYWISERHRRRDVLRPCSVWLGEVSPASMVLKFSDLDVELFPRIFCSEKPEASCGQVRSEPGHQ
jgi:hypothetical protein